MRTNNSLPSASHSHDGHGNFAPGTSSDPSLGRARREIGIGAATTQLEMMKPQSPRRLRVAQVITSVVMGGGGQVISAFSRHLDKSKFQMDVYCIIEGGELVDYIRSQGFNVTVLPIFNQVGRLHYSPTQWLRLAKALRRGSYDVVHTHLYRADFVGGIAALIAGRRHIVKTMHNMGTTKTKYQHAMDQLLHRIATRVVCVSETQRAHIMHIERCPNRKFEVIHNGVDLSRFDIDFDREKLAVGLGLDVSRPIVGTIGRLIEEKGHSYLLQAIPLIAQRFPGIQFLLVGDGPLREELERQIRALRCMNVVITGMRMDVPELLGLMDVFVFPSVSEGLPIALLEAMAAGVPVACSDIPQLLEIVTHNKNAFVFPSEDWRGLAEAVCGLLGNTSLRSMLSLGARAIVEAEFSESSMIRAYEQLYSECAL